LVQAYQSASKYDEATVDILAAFIAHDEAAQTGKPCVRAFYDPAVASQALAAIHPPTRDARRDAAFAAFIAAATVIIGLVSMQLDRPTSRMTAPTAAYVRDRVQHGG
jgi:hypothetical protein